MLKQLIVERIKKQGPIPFKEFMEMALYQPEYGYYTSSDTEIGQKGDFYTSSHVHPVFGAMLGKQMAEMWQVMNMPDEFHIIEIGAGRGYLAGDMLEYLKKTSFFNAIKYTIVEINPFMQKRQEQLLPAFMDMIRWVRSISETGNVKGCVVSNELIDSLPVRLVQMDGDIIKEIYVDIKEDDLHEVLCACNPEVQHYFREFDIAIPANYRTEVNLMAKDWLRDVAAVLHEGFIFTIDYGYPVREYYHPERNRGTLLCYYRHQINENPYQQIGKQDITAHVNFSALKKWGEDQGLATIGYCPQGMLLLSLGMENVLSEIHAGNEGNQSGYGRISTLISPVGMGESHKVMMQYKGQRNPQLKGFALRNQANTL